MVLVGGGKTIKAERAAKRKTSWVLGIPGENFRVGRFEEENATGKLSRLEDCLKWPPKPWGARCLY